MAFDFLGKTALVVGGCSGLGKALVEKFSECGANVYATSRDITKYSEENLFKKKNIQLVNLDVTNEFMIESLIQKINGETSRFDILVYAAVARPPVKPGIPDYHKEDWDYELSINVTGAFLVLKQVAELMKEQKYGKVITIGSIYGVNAIDYSIYGEQHTPASITYASSKAALIHMTKCFACAYGKENITFNCLSPGGIQNNQRDPFLTNYQKKTPLHRMAKREEVVNAVLFLASDNSNYITGQNILVDGGWTIW